MACSYTSFLFYYRIIFHCVIPNLFTYSSDDEHLDYFNLFAIVKNAAVNICVQVLSGCMSFISLWYIPRSCIAEPYGNSVFKLIRF